LTGKNILLGRLWTMVEAVEFVVALCMVLPHTAFSAERKVLACRHVTDSELAAAMASKTVVVVVEDASPS
jgi:hypothetical protein